MSVSGYLVLLHHPIENRLGQLVTTSVTNMDIHDISRSSRTYGMKRFFIVTPIDEQRQLVQRILDHWTDDFSKEHHPDRVEALSLARVVKDFDEVKKAILANENEEPEVILPDARELPNTVSYSDLRQELSDPDRTRPVVIVLGTGWGVSEAFYPAVHRNLAPLYGPEGKEGYNHLSVRAAAATILDRLFGH